MFDLVLTNWNNTKKQKATHDERRQNRLLALLEQKDHEWHDDEYDAGKDW